MLIDGRPPHQPWALCLSLFAHAVIGGTLMGTRMRDPEVREAMLALLVFNKPVRVRRKELADKLAILGYEVRECEGLNGSYHYEVRQAGERFAGGYGE